MKKGVFSKAFTAVELIISVLVIAVLAEIIIPHFMNQRTGARATSISTMTYAVRSGVLLAIKKYHVQQLPTSMSVVLNGKTVRVGMRTGFPTGDITGIGTAIGSINGFASNYGELTTTFELVPAVVNCHVTYWPSSGQVLPTFSGC